MNGDRYSIEYDFEKQGRMWITSLAYDNNLKRKVVIKKLNTFKNNLEQIKVLNKQLHNEAINQAKLTHHNIAKIYDYFEEDNIGNVVEEFVNGKPLSELTELINVKREKKTLNLALDIICKIIEGVKFAHKNKIVHGDIKLENIIYDKVNNDVKIIDFGFSKIKENQNRKNGVFFAGDIEYRPKELFDLFNNKIDNEKSDIFALGIIIYKILTGINPYGNPQNFKMFSIPRISEFRDDISGELDELFYSMIAIQPNDRLSNLEIVLEAIRKQSKQGYSPTIKMPNFEYDIKFRDVIHGYIKLSKDEIKLVNNRFFQRLRNIKQLGTTYLVYPCAVHNRFEHSLGVMHIATRLFDEIVFKNNNILGWNEDEIKKQRQILRLLALLHDIGHGPFSHVSDNLFDDEIKDHENMGAKIIRESELSDIINEIGKKNGGFNFNEIAGLLEGVYSSQYKLIKQIFSGSVIDADRMDYLLRDSYMAGVKYGTYDLEHLIRSINIDTSYGEPILAIDYNGLHVLEEFILARYYMFNQVYFHKTRRIYDKILEKCIKNYLTQSDSVKFVTEINEYSQLDDHRIINYISMHTSNYWNKMFISRNHFKVAYEVLNISSDFDIKLISRIKECLKRSNIPNDKIIIDEYTKAPILFKDEEGYPMLGLIGAYGESLFIDQQSPILSKMNETTSIFRIYVDRSYYSRAVDIIKEVR